MPAPRPTFNTAAIGVALLIASSILGSLGWCMHTGIRIDAGRLADGDLIFIRGSSFRTAAVLALDEGEFSHVGVIWRDGASVRVVHASPEDGVHWVIAQPLQEFLDIKDVESAAVYRVADAKAADVAAHAAQRFAEDRVQFDDAFDLDDASRMYCTELVWRAYLAAGLDLGKDRLTRVNLPFFNKPILLPSALLSHPAMSRVVSVQ